MATAVRLDTNEDIIDYLRDKGYNEETLRRVRESKVNSESLPLLRIEDFTFMGIGIADARLLLVRSSNQLKETELKDLISKVRQGSKMEVTKSKKWKKETITVDFSWYQWESGKKNNKFVMRKLSNGGGVRRKEFQRQTTLAVVFETIEEVFFPQGKNKEGPLTSLERSFCGADLEKIINLNLTIDEYVKKNALKTCKFVLKTKRKSWQKLLTSNIIDSRIDSDDSDDFSIMDKQLTFNSILDCKENLHSTPNSMQLPGHSAANPIKLSSDQSTIDLEHSPNFNYFTSISRNQKSIINEESLSDIITTETNDQRQNLITTQDIEFQNSLFADKTKENKKKEKVKRQNVMRELVPIEASLHEDSVVVIVNHVQLGRVKRLFSCTAFFEDVYYWVGSLSVDPQFFTLNIGNARNVIMPTSPVAVAERQLVMMNPTEVNVITLPKLDSRLSDDFAYSSIPHILESSAGSSQVSKENYIICPICNKKQAADSIVQHANTCADYTYLEIYEEPSKNENNDMNDVEEAEELIRPDTNSHVFKNEKDILVQLKLLLNGCHVVDKGISLKVRRNHNFKDFCSRFSKSWIQEKIGSNIVVSFYGESGIDQGGLRREFFSDALNEMKNQLFLDTSNGFEPSSNLYGDLASGNFKLAGQLMASSICLNGPAPNFLAKWVFNYICGGITFMLNGDVSISDNSPHRKFFKELQDVTEVDSLRKLLCTDDGLDVLSEIGYRGVPQCSNMESKDSVLRAILMKDKMPMTSVLDQICEGLRAYGLLNVIRKNPEVFEYVFSNSSFLKWTFEKFEEFVVPNFSEDGSSKKSVEIDCFKAFMDFMESLFYEGDSLVDACAVLKFVSGVGTIPPLGLSSNLTITFKHWCVNLPKPCHCKPTVSTCSLNLTLPVHYNTFESMKTAVEDAVRMSQGFSKI